MARLLGGHPEATSARAERIDRYGTDLVLTTPGGLGESRIDFTEPVSDPQSMPAAFRELTRRAHPGHPRRCRRRVGRQMRSAGEEWRDALHRSADPQSIVDNAPEPAGSLEPARLVWNPEEDARQPVRPSRRQALEALPDGGSVLDVGVGGASSLGLVPRAGLIVGVDPLAGMLGSFEASARAAGVSTRTVLGTALGRSRSAEVGNQIVQ